MALIYITGPTGAGKSTICQSLKSKGCQAYDTDDEGMRKRINIGGKDLLTINEDKIEDMRNKSEGQIQFICGTSPTDIDHAKLFSKIIVLTLGEEEQKERILNRTNNPYGKNPRQLMNALRWRETQIEKYLAAGATEINAEQKLDEIIEQILKIANLNS